MTKVFVHGNPETTAVWSELVPALRRHGIDDIELLSPPGFGAEVPAGFGSTRIEYRDWLIGELTAIGGEIDLVGHDWGAGHTYAVAAHRPDLLRSWAADCAGLVHPAYEWHPAAQVWQRPGDGEASIAQIRALSGEELVRLFGVPTKLAANIATNLDERMGKSILALYRSAVQPHMREVGDRLACALKRPALLLHATADAFVPPALVFDVANRIQAQVLTLEGLGHWWMFDDADRVAEGLARFWLNLH